MWLSGEKLLPNSTARFCIYLLSLISEQIGSGYKSKKDSSAASTAHFKRYLKIRLLTLSLLKDCAIKTYLTIQLRQKQQEMPAHSPVARETLYS